MTEQHPLGQLETTRHLADPILHQGNRGGLVQPMLAPIRAAGAHFGTRDRPKPRSELPLSVARPHACDGARCFGVSRRSSGALMAKRSVLGWFDRGNQRAMNYVRSRPDSGLKALPYAKSDSARRTAVVVFVIVALIAAIFGWLPGLVALLVASPLLWRLEHHFFFGHRDTDGDPSSQDKASE